MRYLLLFLTFISSSVFAVTPEQNYMSREPQRVEHAKNMQRTHDMLDRSIAALNDGKNVSQSGSSSGSLSDGSKATGGGKVIKPINPAGVGKAIVARLEKAKALGKASLPSFLGSAALTALINGIGWVMDEGGKVKKKVPDSVCSTPDCADPFYQYIWSSSSFGYSSSAFAIANKASTAICASPGRKDCSPINTYTSSDGKEYYYTIQYTDTKGDDDPKNDVVRDDYHYVAYLVPNPNYVPSSPNPGDKYINVSNDELANKVAEQVTNNITNNNVTNIVNNSYSFDSSNGASSADPSNALAVDGANDIRSAVNNASTSSSPNPSGSQRGYYKITDGTKTVEGYVDAGSTTGSGSSNNESTTVTNPDGSTTTTGTTNIELNLPAFCDWASIVCDWYKDWKQSDQVYKDHMTKTEEHQEKEKSFWEKVTDWFDWTKEAPEDKDQPEQEEPDTQGIFSKKFDAVFSLSKECPPDLKFNLETKYLTGTWDFSLNWLCIFFTFIAYPLQLLSHMIGLWVLYEACIRKEIKW